LFWPFLISRFLINPGLLLSTCNHSHDANTRRYCHQPSRTFCAANLQRANFQHTDLHSNAPTFDRQLVAAHAGASLLPRALKRTLVGCS
jgi:hypothetical protein